MGEDQETFMITYRSVLLRMKNAADKSRREKQNTNFIFILVINQLDAQNFLFYDKFISCLYMFRAHVLETCRGMK